MNTTERQYTPIELEIKSVMVKIRALQSTLDETEEYERSPGHWAVKKVPHAIFGIPGFAWAITKDGEPLQQKYQTRDAALYYLPFVSRRQTDSYLATKREQDACYDTLSRLHQERDLSLDI